VLRYDYITAGFDLPALWPEVEGKFYRILPGPSRESPFLTESDVESDIDVSVIGGFGGIFEKRSSIVESLLTEIEGTDIDVRVHGYEYGVGLGSRILKTVLARVGVDDLDIPIEGYDYHPGIEERYPRLDSQLKRPLYGRDFYSMIKRSRLILTIPNNPQISIGSIRPMGIMEGAAAGTCQIALDNDDVRAHFEPGEDIVVFDDIDGLVESIQYYLEFDEERKEIADNSQRRFLEEYCAEEQIERMVSTLPLDSRR
jgi:hypothetical protein